MYKFILFFLCLLKLKGIYCNISKAPIDDSQLRGELKSDTPLLVLFCNKEDDAHCLQIDQRVQQALPITSIKSLKYVTSVNSVLPNEYQLGSLPQLLFFRSQKPILYYADAVNDMDLSEWLSRNIEVSVKELNDDNFEHDTQAASGSTTGDWFIMFFDSSKCNWLVPTWDALASRMKQRLVVGAVDLKYNTKLKERFKLNKCLTLLFFRHGSMYEYDLKAKDVPSLASFAEGWYRNVKKEKVPTESAPFDQMVEKIANALKDKNTRNIAIAVGSSILLIIILLILCSVVFKGKKTKSKVE